MNYYCSKKDQGCRARVKLDANGMVISHDLEHQHPPPKCIFIPIHSDKKRRQSAHVQRLHVFETWQHTKLLLLEKGPRLQGWC
ncbi:jg8400 [Pararge aegeria aegeria]|uniref:Jg8400 protein n=1 Tax=Pararge aegeria aegeria TaxID=348720 RepID=A0A8S4SFE1_9NEOP|nr:jg8400 [Pararge aegeria aegeria]